MEPGRLHAGLVTGLGLLSLADCESAALSGAVSAMGSAPCGYLYLGRHAAGGAARIEAVEDKARVVRQVPTRAGAERISLREVGRRLQALGCPTRTGLGHWDATTLNGMPRNPTHQGTAMFGRARAARPVSFESAKAERTWASSTRPSRCRWQAGRLLQANWPLWLAPRALHRRSRTKESLDLLFIAM